MLPTPHQIRQSSLDTLQHLSILPGARRPEVGTVVEVGSAVPTTSEEPWSSGPHYFWYTGTWLLLPGPPRARSGAVRARCEAGPARSRLGRSCAEMTTEPGAGGPRHDGPRYGVERPARLRNTGRAGAALCVSPGAARVRLPRLSSTRRAAASALVVKSGRSCKRHELPGCSPASVCPSARCRPRLARGERGTVGTAP